MTTQQARKHSLLNNPKFRALVFQLFLIVGLVVLGFYLVGNLLDNMERRGIQSGFDFLTNPTGFDVLFSMVEYDSTFSYSKAYLVGLLNTILVASLGIALATLLGFIIGVARLSRNWLVSKLALVYIETFRNIPLLLQILFWYFAILPLAPMPRQSINIADLFFINRRGFYMPEPIFSNEAIWTVVTLLFVVIGTFVLSRWAKKRQDKTGQAFPHVKVSLALIVALPLLVFWISGSPLSWDIPELGGFNFRGGWVLLPELIALWLALSIYTAAFIAEIVRSGIQAVDYGQKEAAKSLGLKPNRVLSLVVIPQAMRVIIPQMTSQYLNLTKNSSLAMAIGYPDLTAIFMGTSLNQTGRAVEIVAMTMATYLTISLLTSLFMNWYNAKMKLVER